MQLTVCPRRIIGVVVERLEQISTNIKKPSSHKFSFYDNSFYAICVFLHGYQSIVSPLSWSSGLLVSLNAVSARICKLHLLNLVLRLLLHCLQVWVSFHWRRLMRCSFHRSRTQL